MGNLFLQPEDGYRLKGVFSVQVLCGTEFGITNTCFENHPCATRPRQAGPRVSNAFFDSRSQPAARPSGAA
jgi:hypothetical protein